MSEINNSRVNYYQVDESSEEQRLDNLLTKILKGVPKSHIYRIIRSGEVRINKARCDVGTKLKLNDIVRIPPIKVSEKPDNFIPEGSFPIVYEDEYYLIINKPSGVACHGGSGVSFGVIEQLRKTNKYKFLELAHRLDKDTSGMLILAKKRSALVQIQELSKNNKITKEYYALTLGKWKNDKRNLKANITKFNNSDGERRVKIDHTNGQFAHTIFTVIEKFSDYTLVNADIQTGKTHQIRIHCNFLGYPIAGDDKYGIFEKNKSLSRNGLKRMFLHAHHLKFIHPITNTQIDLECPLPEELAAFINNIRKNIA